HWYFVEETIRRLFPWAKVCSGIEPERAISKGLALTPLPLTMPARARSASVPAGTAAAPAAPPQATRPVAPPAPARPAAPAGAVNGDAAKRPALISLAPQQPAASPVQPSPAAAR